MKHFVWWSLPLCIILMACHSRPVEVEKALVLSGKNRVELEKVLEYYQSKNKKKYDAACFLISYMPYHKTQHEIDLDSAYLSFFSQLDSLYAKILIKGVRTRQPEYDSIVNRLVNAFNHYPPPLQRMGTNDLQHIDADYLINSIEASFREWENSPFLKNLSFEEFKEAVLPYRAGKEHPSFTKQELREKFIPILSSGDTADIRTAIGNYIRYVTEQRILFRDAVPTGHLGMYDMYMNAFKMSCFEITTWSCNILRACGLPVYFEFTPQYTDRANPHFWCASPDSVGIPLPYTVPDNNLMDDWDRELRYSSKVYRYTFGINRDAPYFTAGFDEKVPENLSSPTMLDVTWRYHPSIILRLPIENDILENNVYLCVFNSRTGLQAVGWGQVNHDNKEVVYKQVPVHQIFFPARYVNGEYIPISDPFVLIPDSLADMPSPFSQKKPYRMPDLRLAENDQLVKSSLWAKGNKHIRYQRIKPGGAVQDILINRKYPTKRHLAEMHKSIRGGVLAGYNKRGEYDTLFTLSVVPQPYLQEFSFPNKKKYRNYSFIGAPGCAVNMAEFEFLGRDIPRTLRAVPTSLPVFSPGDMKKDTLMKAVGIPFRTGRDPWSPFDGNMETYSGSSSLGMDFQEPICITHIRLAPRNANNMIVKGDRYELMYYDNGWKSMGKQTAEYNYLQFTNVPAHTLYWLRNLDHGKEELPFFYNGNQRFISEQYLIWQNRQ